MHRYIVTTAVVCYLAITSAPSCIAAPMNNVNHGSNRYKHPQQQTLPSFVNEADHGSHKYEFTKPPVLRDPVDDDDPGSNKLEINRPPPLFIPQSGTDTPRTSYLRRSKAQLVKSRASSFASQLPPPPPPPPPPHGDESEIYAIRAGYLRMSNDQLMGRASSFASQLPPPSPPPHGDESEMLASRIAEKKLPELKKSKSTFFQSVTNPFKLRDMSMTLGKMKNRLNISGLGKQRASMDSTAPSSSASLPQ